MEKYTKEEMREILIGAIKQNVSYWKRQDKENLDGLAFSILNIFDGTSGSFPCAIDLVMCPHDDDKQYCIDNNVKWIEKGMVINDDCMLHELYVNDKEG